MFHQELRGTQQGPVLLYRADHHYLSPKILDLCPLHLYEESDFLGALAPLLSSVLGTWKPNCVYDKPLVNGLQEQCDSSELFNTMVRARFLVYRRQENQILTGGHVEVNVADAIAVCKKMSVPRPREFIGEGGICVEELIEKILNAVGFNNALNSLGRKHYIHSCRKSVVDRSWFTPTRTASTTKRETS